MEVWKYKYKHTIHHRFNPCSNKTNCKNPRESGYLLLYIMRNKEMCERCAPTREQTAEDKMTAWRQLIDLGKGKWKYLVVEDGRENWVVL
jgi:hypothetical protein